MSRRLLLALATFTIIAMVAIPFISNSSSSAVELTKVDPAYGAYVSAYTSGTISNESYIRVTLAEDYTGPVTLDKPVDENYFTFEPGIDGKTYWLDSRTLEFRPGKRMESDKIFNVEFALGKVNATVPKELSTMKFSFRTMRQAMNVMIDGMKTTDRKSMRVQQLRGTVTTADAADAKVVEKVLSAKQDGRNLTIRWEHEGDNATHRFFIDSIARRDKESTVQLAWDGKPLGVSTKETRNITIPSLKDFKVTSARVEHGQEQYVLIEFSDPIAEKQNLDGLISLKGESGAMRFTVEDNSIKAYPETQLIGNHTLIVSTGIKNIAGASLPHGFTQVLSFEALKPQVKLMGKGVILPNSGNGLLFPFQAVSLKAIDVKVIRIYEDNIPQYLQVNSLDGNSELYRVGKVVVKKRIDLNVKSKADYGRWCNYSLDMADLIKAEPGAIYRVTIGFKKEYSAYNCPADTTNNDNDNYTASTSQFTPDEEDSEVGQYGYYGSDYYEYNYWYGGDDDDPCDKSYYYGKSVSRNILASDLGLIAKRGTDGSMLFAVNDLITTKPVNAVDLEVYDYQHQLLTQVKTDASGFAKVNLPKKRPFLLIAKNGTQRGYLKLDDGSSISVSAFDVSGETVQKGLKGFIYGERGVWRPGDTLFLSFILEDKNKLLPATHPVTFELVNARGQLVDRVVRSQSVNGFYNFTTTTDPDAPTGNWTARIKVGGAVFTKTLKVETVMPNRLKINLDFGGVAALSNDKNQKVKIEARWLHGAIAKNLKTQVDVSLYQSKTTFKGYENYNFDDPASDFYTENKIIFDDRLDENGKAEFNPELKAEDAPGMLRASFNTRVFEEGGAFSVDRFTMNFSPYDTYVGVLVPKGDGWGGMLETGKDWGVRVVTVDKNGKPVSRDKITVRVYKVDWRWWWSSDYDNLSRYVSSSYYEPYYTTEISTKNGIGQFNLNVANEDYGRYLVHVTDEAGGHSSGMVSWFDWPYWDGSGTKNTDVASLLQFSSDKVKYNVGETMNITIPSPGQGRALISVETGSRVINAFWAETAAKGNITAGIPITDEMSPNVYVHVTLIQPHAQTRNDAPIRMYGVIPVEVDDPKTHLTPQLTTSADVWKPEELASVSVYEKDGKPMTYTLAVVDEGLLDLTRFQTPDPWENFYSREALGVKTFDMYDMVMGAYGAEMERVLGIGGDGENATNGGKKANRFKPMVKFMGPFELKAGERQTKTFMMPQYVGSVRVMVIAGQNNAYGRVDKTVPVRKPLMLLGTLPRVVGPGEIVDLPVNVFAMEKKVKNVVVTVTTNDLFTVEDNATKSTSFKDVGDNIVTFRLKVKEAVGVGKVKIVARGDGERAEYEIELDVRNPNTRMTDSYEAVIDPGQTWTSDYTPVGVAGTNSGTLEISSIPPLNLGQRLDYLISYPHGCIEQTTSSVFPQLYLTDLIKLDDDRKNRIAFNIKAGIDRLRNFQTPAGAFGYWPGDQNPSDWGSNYAGHFLLEAEQKGYTLPAGLIDGWKKYQRETAINWTPRNDKRYYYNDDLIQAYRLYTLALAKAPELGAMNRLRESANLGTAAKWRLAAAYQLAGQPDIAQKLVNGLTLTITPYTELSYSYGSHDRDHAMILETLSLMGGTMRTKGAPLAKSISETLNRTHWLSTQTTAYSLIALCKFSGADKTSGGVNCEYTVDKQSGKVSGKELIATVDMKITGVKGGKATVKNNGTNVLFVRVVMAGVPAAGKEVDAANNLGMTVNFTTMNGLPLDVSRIEQGTDFIAQVTINNPGLRGEYREMALTQIFPSGWEIRNERMEAGPSTITNDHFDYQDIRDDRVYTYFYVSGYRARTYSIQLNAAYAGHFYLPAFYCEAMYDATINARKAGQWVDVVPSGMMP